MKLIKTYLRISNSNERLSNLALLSLEHEYVNGLDFDTFVDEFDGRHNKNVLNYINC